MGSHSPWLPAVPAAEGLREGCGEAGSKPRVSHS